MAWRHKILDNGGLTYKIYYPNGLGVFFTKKYGETASCCADLWTACIFKDEEILESTVKDWLTDEAVVAYCDHVRSL